MKNLVYVAAVVVLLNIGSYCQDAKPAETEAPASSTKPQADPTIREKFDPTRDPKADLETAIAAAAKSGKRIILDVGGEWCSWCIYMDRFFVKNPTLSEIRDDNFIWVKVNMSEQNENRAFLSSYPEPRGYPHLYVLTKTGKLLHSHDTSDLENGKIYDLARFTRFLKTWSPKKAN